MAGNRRILSVVATVLGLAVSAGPAAGVATPQRLSLKGTTPSPSEHAIVRAMNSVRMAYGVRPLRVGRALTRAARAHSVDMQRKGYFEHGAFVRRLRSFGVRAPYIGENLASGSQPLSAAAIVEMWIESPPHRKNLLDPSFRRIGVGVADSSEKIVTADFAGAIN